MGAGQRRQVFHFLSGEKAMKQTVLALFQRKKPWLIAIGVLLLLNIIAIAGIAFFQLPAVLQKKELVTKQQKSLEALVRGDENAIYRKGKSDLVKLQETIPPKRGFAPLLAEIMDSSAECNLSTDSLTYKPEHLSQRNLLVYRIVLSVSGRYSAIRCFLHNMQARKELVVIDAMTLDNDDPYAENVSMELRLTVYLRDGA